MTNGQKTNGQGDGFPVVISKSAGMSDRELLYLGRRILAVAVEWRELQDEVGQAVHSAIVAVRQGNRPTAEEVSPISVTAELREDSPELWDKYDDEHLQTAIAELLATEIRGLSALFSGLYVEFNERYFDGRLPVLTVKVSYDAVHGKGNLPQVVGRQIVLAYCGWPEDMVALLLERMAGVFANQSGQDWGDELERLDSLNAPTRDNIDRRETDQPWPWERSAYGPVRIDQFGE